MKKRNPYKTAQQEAMLQYFLEDKHNFLTVKDLLSSLQKLQIDIGQTTVYRFLEFTDGHKTGFGRICH